MPKCGRILITLIPNLQWNPNVIDPALVSAPVSSTWSAHSSQHATSARREPGEDARFEEFRQQMEENNRKQQEDMKNKMEEEIKRKTEEAQRLMMETMYSTLSQFTQQNMFY